MNLEQGVLVHGDTAASRSRWRGSIALSGVP
jgi:hypothetical protein